MAALYRRYRPETFQEVIGQTHVTSPLRHALTSDRSHHAYLFSGPRGCGKTTSARILARCLNCAKGPTDTPCGECPSCVELSRDGGGSLDVVEIDAASHNGVDDARELRERAVFAPARDRYKIYILDEAHMVTQQGFNALLKIVEEPPEHVKFIFATTDPDKVLPTIRSRTHHYPFRLVAPAELLTYLQHVAESEGVTIEEGVLALVVRSGGGSVRDSLSLLDQLMAGSSEQIITLEGAQALLGYTPRVLLDEVVAAFAAKDAPAAFRSLDSVMQSGQDPRRFVEDLLTHIRDIIVIQATGNDAHELFPGVSQGDLEMWREQASWFTPGQLADMGREISDTLQHMSGVTAPRLQLELMVAKLLVGAGQSSGSQATAPPAPAEARAATAPATSPAALSATPPTAPAATPETAPDNGASAAATPPESTPVTSPPTAGTTADHAPSEPAAETPVSPLADWGLDAVVERWSAIVESVGEQKRSLWVVLSETKPVALDGDVLTIGFVKRSDANILKKPQGPGSPLPQADLLREAIYQHTGHRVRFTVSELEPHEVPIPQAAAGSAWPVVSRPGSDVGDASDASDASVPGDAVDTADTSDSRDASDADAGAQPTKPPTEGEALAETESPEAGSPETEGAEATPPEEPKFSGVDSEPEGSPAGEASAADEATSTAGGAGADAGASARSASGPQLATRGEPVLREVLGGELIGEEILGEMSGQGEADV